MIASLIYGLMILASPDAAEDAEPADETVTAQPAAPVQDDVVCRRKFSTGHKVGERNSSSKVCKTRAEWEADRRKRR